MDFNLNKKFPVIIALRGAFEMKLPLPHCGTCVQSHSPGRNVVVDLNEVMELFFSKRKGTEIIKWTLIFIEVNIICR